MPVIEPSHNPVAYVNVTDPDGVLIGRFPLYGDDLTGRNMADQSIGAQVREQFPTASKDNDGQVWPSRVNAP